MKIPKPVSHVLAALGIGAALGACILLVITALVRTVHADTGAAVGTAALAIPWEAWFIGGLAALAGLESALKGIAAAVRAISRLTKTTVDDHIADGLEAADARFVEGLAILRGLRPAASPPSSGPPTRAAGAVLSVLTVITVIVGGGLAASCAAARQRGGAAVGAFLDCEAADIPPAMLKDATDLATQAVRNVISGSGSIDASQLKADAALLRSDLGKCALAGAIAAIATPVPTTPGAPAADPLEVDGAALRGAFARVRGDLGWAPVRLADGQVL